MTLPGNFTDGRFGVGPSKIRPEAMAALEKTASTYLGTSHRQERARTEVRRLRDGLRALLNLPDGHEIVLGVGGATAFWEVATFSLIRERAQFLSFGEFSAKFAAAASAAPHLGEHTVIKAEPGGVPVFVPEAGIDTYATVQNETSTGVCLPLQRPENSGDALFVVDATSSAGGVLCDIDNVDAYYFSLQKCFAAEGGLWVAVLSPRAVQRVEEISASGRYIPAFLSLKTAIENSRKDQTYNTPALATVFLAAEQVEWVNAQGGLAWAADRCRTSSQILYDWTEDTPYVTPFVQDEKLRSPTVVTLDFDDTVDAAHIAAILRREGIVDTEPYRKLGRNQLRISTFPAIEPSDVTLLTERIASIVAEMQNS